MSTRKNNSRGVSCSSSDGSSKENAKRSTSCGLPNDKGGGKTSPNIGPVSTASSSTANSTLRIPENGSRVSSSGGGGKKNRRRTGSARTDSTADPSSTTTTTTATTTTITTATTTTTTTATTTTTTTTINADTTTTTITADTTTENTTPDGTSPAPTLVVTNVTTTTGNTTDTTTTTSTNTTTDATNTANVSPSMSAITNTRQETHFHFHETENPLEDDNGEKERKLADTSTRNIIPKYGPEVDPGTIWDSIRTLKDNTIYGKVKLCQDRKSDQLVAVKLCERLYVDKHQSVKGSRVQEDVREEVRLLRLVHEQVALLAHTVEGVCPGCGVVLVAGSPKNGGEETVAGNCEEADKAAKNNPDWLAVHKGVKYGDVDVGIVKLIAEAECPIYYWTVLEFMAEGDAFDLVQRVGGLPEAKEHFRRLAKAVSVMHKIGVAHLDLSLENCLVNAQGTMVLCDFGLARECGPDTLVTDKIGKLQYWAPEIFAGRPTKAFAADVWSLGVMLFLMLVGAPPYKLPAVSDKRYEYIISGRLDQLLRVWKKVIDPLAVELMQMMLTPDRQRISLQAVLEHPWLA